MEEQAEPHTSVVKTKKPASDVPKQHYDLRDHLNRKRQPNVEKKGPPPDPQYNFLADPMRDEPKNTEKYNQGYSPRGGFDNRNYVRGRSRGFSYGNYRGRGFRGPTRSRGRGRGYQNWQQGSYTNYNSYQHQQQTEEYVPKYYGKKEDTKEYPTENTNERKKYVIENTEDSKFDKNPKRYSAPRGNYYVPSNYRGSDRGRPSFSYRGRLRSTRGFPAQRRMARRNYRNVAPVNIKVEFNSITGEHKYTLDHSQKKIEKPSKEIKKPEGQIGIHKVIIEDGENWEEEEEVSNHNEKKDEDVKEQGKDAKKDSSSKDDNKDSSDINKDLADTKQKKTTSDKIKNDEKNTKKNVESSSEKVSEKEVKE